MLTALGDTFGVAWGPGLALVRAGIYDGPGSFYVAAMVAVYGGSRAV